MPSVEELIQGPLVAWVKKFYEDDGKELDYCQLCDGVFLHEIMLQIDPRPPHRGVCQTGGDVNVRIRNLDILVRNVKAFYEDILGQLIVVRLPDVIRLGREPDSEGAAEEVERLLLLILGCAVQCNKKEEIVENIKKLDVGTQHSIVECIQQVTDNPETVWLQEWAELNLINSEQQELMYRYLMQHMKRVVKERDEMWHNTTALFLEKECGEGLTKGGCGPFSTSGCDKHRYGVELADCKAKSRRLRQELEDKTESLAEFKEELEQSKQYLNRLKQENLNLVQDARAAKTYRDEIDILKERVSRVDKLESELQRYKDRMNELEFCKSRIEELREDNRILIETKEMLEDQLENSRKKASHIPELENEILKLKTRINDLTLEKDAVRDRLQELIEENTQLQMSTKQCMNESVSLMAELDHLRNHSPDQGLGDSLCDQINKDTQLKLSKLELENQRLNSLIEQIKDGTFYEYSEKILELEKENKRLSLKVEFMQDAADKETRRCVDLEQRQIEITRETNKLQQVLDMVRVSSERQQMELQREKSQLAERVDNLRSRIEKSNDARLIDIEAENLKLNKRNEELRSQMSRLSFDKNLLDKYCEKLQISSEKIAEIESQKVQMERENSDLQQAIAAFKQTCDKFEKVEQENCELKVDNKKLNKKIENLQNSCIKIEKLEHDNICLTIENQKLMKCLDSFQSSSIKVLELEQEKHELEQSSQMLKKNCDALRMDRAKYEQMELDLISLNTENQKHQKIIESINKKMHDLEQENQELDSENQKLQQTVETYKVTTRKLNDLERENTDLEGSNHKLEREKSSVDKEICRLKQAAEIKDLTIDEFGSKVSILERENKKLLNDIENIGLSINRVGELEKENRELVQQAAVDKKALATLREDLVSEKIRNQQLSNDLDKLTAELQKIGINKEKIMAAELSQDEDRYKALESMIDEALKKSLELKEEKIHGLESRLQESANRNNELREELRNVKRNYEALKQRHEEEMINYSSTPTRSENTEIKIKSLTKQISECKDQLADNERVNGSLVVENQNIKSQLNSAREQICALHSQVTSLQHQAAALTEQNSVLQSQTARLQVEASTVQSHNSLLTSQLVTLQNLNSTLEASKEELIRRQEEMQSSQEALVTDHEALQKLHEQLSGEYDSLLNELNSLKVLQKNLKLDCKNMTEKYQAMVASQDELAELRRSLDEEKELLKSDSKSLANLRAEHSRLKDDFRLLHTNNERLKMEYKSIQTEYKNLKTEYNTTKLRNMEIQGELAECRDQSSTLDIEVSKLASKCEMLTNVNMTLNEERRSLMNHVSHLLSQYHELLTQALEDKEHFHEKEKNNMDKVNQLERQKSQLEAKIIEQFIRMDNYSPKKKGFGANLVRKVRRAGTELINKVPRTRSKENEKERIVKVGEGGEGGDNQDNSSMGSGSIGHDSPDSSSETIAQVKDENGDVSESGCFERRNSIRRSVQSKSNSIFYTKIPPDDGIITGGSVSSEDIVSLQDTQSHDSSGIYGDIESVTSNCANDSSQFNVKNNESSQEEICSGSTRLSLGTPGTRRAVYYTEDNESGTTVTNNDSISNGDSPLHRSPSIGPKFGRLSDRSSMQGSPQVRSWKNSLQNRPIRNTTSEYCITSAVGSPVLPPRNVANSLNGSRNWNNKNRDVHMSMTEISHVSSPTSSITSKESNISQVPLINSVKNWGSDQSDCELSNFTNSNGRPGSGIGRVQPHPPLPDTSVDSNVSNLNSEGSSSPNHRVQNSQMPINDSNSGITYSPNLSLRSNSNRNNSASVVRTSSLLIANNSAKANQQLINNSLPKANSEKGMDASDLPSQNQSADNTAPKTIDNSIWYEYGCV